MIETLEYKPLVSVVMITYNHELYISKAIEGVLDQKCDFPVEFIIADDCSNDNTTALIKEIITAYKGSIKIRFESNKKNKGMMGNFIDALNSAKGKYIALCEGDDYWTASDKLEKQVKFLNKNEDHVICFHKVKILDNDTDAISTGDVTDDRFSRIQEKPINIFSLLKEGNFIHTPSVMFRNRDIDFPPEFILSTVGDYFLYIILAQDGYIHRIDEYMAVYRKGSGIHSTLSSYRLQQNILKYHLCIQSYLTDTKQRRVFFERIQKVLIDYNRVMLNYSMSDKFLVQHKGLWTLIILPLKKIVFKITGK